MTTSYDKAMTACLFMYIVHITYILIPDF